MPTPHELTYKGLQTYPMGSHVGSGSSCSSLVQLPFGVRPEPPSSREGVWPPSSPAPGLISGTLTLRLTLT